MTTQEEIGCGFDEGVRQKKTHMLVVVDTFDYEDYFVYFHGTPAEARAFVAKYPSEHQMQSVMECYDLNGDKKMQIRKRRTFVYGDEAAPIEITFLAQHNGFTLNIKPELSTEKIRELRDKIVALLEADPAGYKVVKCGGE